MAELGLSGPSDSGVQFLQSLAQFQGGLDSLVRMMIIRKGSTKDGLYLITHVLENNPVKALYDLGHGRIVLIDPGKDYLGVILFGKASEVTQV